MGRRTRTLASIRRNRLYLGLLAGLLGGGAHAATFSVDTVLDSPDANPGNGVAEDAAGRTSLRAAIEEAVALGGPHTINFAPALVAGGDQTITLTNRDTGLDPGEFGATAFIIGNATTLNIVGPSGDNGVTVERSAASNTRFRLFHVQPGSSLNISNLAFGNGAAVGGRSGSRTAGAGGGAGLGGGIFNQGSLALNGVTLFGNSATGGAGGNGGAASDGGSGGGGAGGAGGQSSSNTGGTGGGPNGGAPGNNPGGIGGGGGGGTGRSGAGSGSGGRGGDGGLFGGAGGGGGSLCTGGGSGVCNGGRGGDGGFGGGGGGGGSVVSFNYTRNVGVGGTGGFGAGSGTNGRADPNSFQPAGDGGGGGGFGGAIFNFGGSLTVRNSTISGSTATGGGSGGLTPYGQPGGPAADGGGGSGFGAAIFSMNNGGTAASVDLRHVTVTDSAVAGGVSTMNPGSGDGAIYILGDAGTSTITVNNSIIANTAGGADFRANSINAGATNSSGVGNLLENSGNFGGTVAVTTDPDLAGLIDNRGPTPTHALNTGSPAIDAGDPGQIGGLATDQRGGIFQRVVDGDLNGSSIVDIGAYELIQIDYGDAPDFAPGTGDVEVLLENGSDDLRISSAGTNGDTARAANSANVAYNATSDQYLVVWVADNDATDNEFEVWGRRVNAATRATIGGEFRISAMDADGNRDASAPAVAWSSATNEYLVVWQGDNEATDNEFEIYGRFVAANGSFPAAQFLISNMGTPGNTNDRASDPELAYSATSNEFLVVWQGDEDVAPLVDNEFEIFGQRISAASRSAAGGRMQISQMGGANGVDPNADASTPQIAWNSVANQFLVVWSADDGMNGGMVDNEFEIFGRLVAGGGSPLGASQVRITDLGGSGDSNSRASVPYVAFNSSTPQFLVTFNGDDALVSDNETEIFGRFVNAATGNPSGAYFRISDVGLPGSTAFFGSTSATAYNPVTGNYIVAFHGDEEVDNEQEIWARRVDSTGTVLDADEFRVSNMGPDGSTSFGAFNAAIAYSSGNSDTLIVFQGDDDVPPLVDNESEVFGQVITDTMLVDYQTRGADNGPAHVRVAGMRLGPLTDNDPDGLPSVDADGDDNDNLDDEDAITGSIEFASTAPVLSVNVTNTSGAAATLYGWIDYNGDGIFDNATERGMAGVADGSNGANVNLTLPVPPGGSVPLTMARFRLSSDAAAANAVGLVTGGEVEDYLAINNIDTTPNQFMFVDQTDVPFNTVITSAAVEITGINTPAPITVSGGSYSINGGPFTSAAGTVNVSDMIRAQHTSAGTSGTNTDTTVTVGGVMDVFRSTTIVIDTDPTPFIFTDVTDVPRSTQQVSNSVTISDINVPTPISVIGGEYSIDNGAFTAMAGTINNGSTVRVRHDSSANFNTTVDTTLTVGSESDTFSSSTELEDTVPAQFMFTDLTDVTVSALQTSDPITVADINSNAPISVVGGSYSINGGAFTSAPGTVVAGDMVRAQHTSSPNFSTAVDTTVTIGGVFDVFTSTTEAIDITPAPFAFTAVNDVPISTVQVSNAVTITDINTAAAISISAGSEYSIDGAAFTSAAGTINAGSMVRVRHTSSGSFSTAVNSTLTVGTENATFTSTTEAEDLVPAPFLFTDQVDVPRSSVRTSNAISVTDINSTSPITVTGGSYSINGAAFTSAPGTVVAGDMVRAQHTSAPGFAGTVDTLINIGGEMDTFSSTTEAEDLVPAPFMFTDQVDVPRNSLRTSNAITVTDINSNSPITVTGGSYSINGGAFTSAPGTVVAGDMVRAQHTSAPGFSGTVDTLIDIGGEMDTFSSTTLAIDTMPDQFMFTDVTEVPLGATITSDPVTIVGINAPAPISVSGGLYSINGGAFTAAAGTVNTGDEVRAQHVAAATIDTDTDTTVTVGGVIDTFTSRTIMAVGDAQITKTSDRLFADPGELVTYTISIDNVGVDPIEMATVNDVLPAELTAGEWSCVASGGASCSAIGTGDINDSITLPLGGTVVYTLKAIVVDGVSGLFDNTATVTLINAVDTDPSNNSATASVESDLIFKDQYE